jgi:hypothetical protein
MESCIFCLWKKYDKYCENKIIGSHEKINEIRERETILNELSAAYVKGRVDEVYPDTKE